MSYNVLNRKRYGEMVEHVRRYGCECSSHTIKWSYLYIMYVEITHITKRLDREGMICLSNEWWNVCTTTIPALRISYIHIWYTYVCLKCVHVYENTYVQTFVHLWRYILISSWCPIYLYKLVHTFKAIHKHIIRHFTTHHTY